MGIVSMIFADTLFVGLPYAGWLGCCPLIHSVYRAVYVNWNAFHHDKAQFKHSFHLSSLDRSNSGEMPSIRWLRVQ